MWVIDRTNDPVSVRQSYSQGKVELRIGKERPGETRYARLNPREARGVAYALLSAAEEAEERSS